MRAESLEAVYQQHMNDLYRYLLQLSGHPQTAEDLVQDTFVKAYEQLESYQGEKVRPGFSASLVTPTSTGTAGNGGKSRRIRSC